jgi:hypothetical protein
MAGVTKERDGSSQCINGLVPIHPEQFCASTSRTAEGLQ